MHAPMTDPQAAWKQRFRVATTYGRTARRDHTRGLAVSNHSGSAQLYAWDVPHGTLRQLTQRPAGQTSGVLSGDGRFVYFLNDEQGNELGHYVCLDVDSGALVDITPTVPPYASFNFSTDIAGALISYITADQNGFQVFVQPTNTANHSAAKRIYHTASFVNGLALSYAGELAVLATTEGRQALEFTLCAFDTASGALIATLSDGVNSSIEAGMFAPLPNDERVLTTSNRTGATRPLIWHVRSGERIDLALDTLNGDVIPQDWSPDGTEILLLHVHQAVHQLYRYQVDNGALFKLAHPPGTFFGAYFGPDNAIFANWQNATTPQQLIALDAATGALQRVVLGANTVPHSRPWRSVSFASSDGQRIQGWLAVPEGDGPFPTILETHGGPTYALTEVFHAGGQAWLDHGYAFLSINYRGSTTFGRAFEQQIWGDLGHWEVEDMVAARTWLVEHGIADPAAILLTGWSYGGYLTLQALGTRPELWAGGMAGIAIADWTMQYEDSAETLKGYQVALLGGTPESKPKVYAAASPITYVEHVAAPILVIQGSNDTRCPARPMQIYAAKLRALDKDIEVEWFEAGHGSHDTAQSIAHQERMLRWAYRVLG